jgi:hypothetical protein
VHCCRDILKVIWSGIAIFSGNISSILWLIISGPNTLLGYHNVLLYHHWCSNYFIYFYIYIGYCTICFLIEDLRGHDRMIIEFLTTCAIRFPPLIKLTAMIYRWTGLYMTGNVVVYGVLGSWCLTPLSTIFQLHVHVQTVYHGRQFY